jgi:hypothetical protein
MAKAFPNTGVTTGLSTDRTGLTGMFAGQHFFETNTGKVFVYSGSAWVECNDLDNTGAVSDALLLRLQAHSNVNQTFVTATASTTSVSYTDIPGMSVNITPKFNTSKVLVTAVVTFGFIGTQLDYARLMRGSTALGNNQQGNGIIQYRPDAYSTQTLILDTRTVTYLDSPATTAATTYKMQWYVNTGTLWLNRRGLDANDFGTSSITVQEIPVYWRCFMFNSNVQPKRRVKESVKEPWYCHSCNLENKAFYSKCPSCGEHRPH